MSCFWVRCSQQKTNHGPESNKVEGEDQHCRFSSHHCMYVPSFTCMYTCMYARFICTYKYNKIFFIVCILLILVQNLIISFCLLQVFFFSSFSKALRLIVKLLNCDLSCDAGFSSVCYKYVSLPLINKEATLAYGRTKYR